MKSFTCNGLINELNNARKVSKYGYFSGSYFPVFSPNTGKSGPENTPYLDTFQAVIQNLIIARFLQQNCFATQLVLMHQFWQVENLPFFILKTL